MMTTHLKLDDETKNQINQCLNLVKEIFGQDLLGVYLYGSSILGGLQKYSDIDLLVVTNRASTHEEKTQLATQLLQISGVYMVSTKLPIEMTLVEKAEINPWHYPPNFDFQYGDWLREQFESGIIEPWSTKEMPDLALLITQVLLASKTLFGADADQLLSRVPYKDFMIATTDALQNLMSELNSDTRNVLLTLSRIWSTVATDSIRSKPAAADWAIDRLPEQYHPVMKRAKAICNGVEKEHWDDLGELIKPCADFIIGQINNKVIEIELSNNTTKSIKLAEPRMFKADWEKTSVTCQLQEGLVEKMVRLAYPDKKLSSHELIAGGCANLNIKVLLEGEKHPLILRIYLRDKEAAHREQKLAALLKQTAPIPLTYYIGELEGYHFAFIEFMPGIPLRDLLLGDAPHDLSTIMHEVGTILSKIAAYEFSKAGFFDQELQVIPYESSDVIKFAQECLDHKTVLAVLTHEMISKILDVLEQYGHLFPDENEKHLVHGDFDPANILVEKVNGTWGVTGILDWEFAFSGSVLWDAANMLRYAHKMPPEFESSFIETLKKSGIKLQHTWRTTIHLLNLTSLLDCLKRADGSVLNLLFYTFLPNSKRLMKRPITISCIHSDFEKQIVLRTRRLMRVRKVKNLRSIFCVLRLPSACSS